MRNWRLARHTGSYFPIKLIKTVNLDPEKSYLMGYHPHGVMTFGAFGGLINNHLGVRELFPGHTTRLFVLPLMVRRFFEDKTFNRFEMKPF